MRPHISIWGRVRRSVGRSVSRSVRRSPVFFRSYYWPLDGSAWLLVTLEWPWMTQGNSGWLWGRIYWSTLGLVNIIFTPFFKQAKLYQLKFHQNQTIFTVCYFSFEFLVACTRLYRSLCRSVGRSVRRSVGPSVRNAPHVIPWMRIYETASSLTDTFVHYYWEEFEGLTFPWGGDSSIETQIS